MRTIQIVLAVLLLTACQNKKENHMYTEKIKNLYKEIKSSKNQPNYWLFIHNTDCSYEIRVNDMFIYSHYETDGSNSLSFPLNNYFLKSGKHEIKITILPSIDDNNNLKRTIYPEN